jgi:Lar family restriction alleviation protein
MKGELLPCPFCGGDPGVVVHALVDGASVYCMARDCDAVASSETIKAAVVKWNRRAPSTVADAARREGRREVAEEAAKLANLWDADLAADIRALGEKP